MFIADYHFHTSGSFDGKDGLPEYIRQAEQKGISEICVTNHYECGTGLRRENASLFALRDEYWKAVSGTRQSPVTVRFGVELGEPLHDKGAAEVAVCEGHFDFIIASLHYIRGCPVFGKIDFRSPDPADYAERYYDELEEIIDWGKFDVLGHLNYFERHAARQGVRLDMEKYFPRLADLFVKLIEKGKGIEVNTSGLFGPQASTMPDEAVLRLYRGLGGRIVTVGSDSHEAQNVGRGFEQAVAMLKRAGFDSITVFEERTPRQIKI